MITFNNIVERFEDFATSHFFIKSFSFGSPDDVDLAKFTEFPLMHLVYTGATYDSGTKTYNIEVYILDVPADKTDKVERQREVVSDAEQCAEDIIADIRMGGNIFTFAQDYEVVNATTTPLEEETKNVLSGVLLDLSVAIPYEWDACNAPIDGVTPEGGDEPAFARRGFLRMLTIDGATDVLSVRTINVTNGTLTDDGDGVVTLNTGGAEKLDDLSDVDINTPVQGSVISYNSGVQKWMVNNGLQELLTRFKASGTGAQVYDTLNDTTKGYIDILASSAKMKVNHSGLTVSEASPGVMSFTVAAGTDGNEVEFEAMTIEGSDALSTIADVNFKQGALTYWENATGKIWLRAPNAGNITVILPSSAGTLALTTDIPSVPVDSVNGQTGVVVLDTGDIDENGNLYFTDARVAANSAVAANTAKVGITPTQASEITANTAKVGITTQQASDITANNAKTGITTQQASDITANNAKIALVVDDTSPQLGGNLDVQAREIDTSTTNGNIIVAPNGTGVLEVKGDTNDGAIQLNCNQNSHGVKIQSPPHSAGATYTLVLPTDTGTNGQALTTDGAGTLSFSDVAVGTKYHDRFQTDAETFRSGATATVELYYTAKADGDGLAESASSDTPTAGKVIKRKIYYSEAAFADPDTGTWVEFTPAPADDASFATVKAALLEYLKARTGGTVPISLKQTWEEVTAAPAFTGLLNETYGSGAAAAYSTRRLNGNVTECMVIRRASDSTTTTIGFDSNGNIDEAAITTFCTGTSCTVYQWLDQSGNGNTATQTTPANQPTIYTGGACVKRRGRVSLDFSSDSFTFETEITTDPIAVFSLHQDKVGNGIQFPLYKDSGNRFYEHTHYGQQRFRIGGTFAIKSAKSLDELNLSSIVQYTDGTSAEIYRGGTELPNLSSGYRITTQTGAFTQLGSNYTGDSQEVIIYSANKTSVRTSIESNIGDYFTQNTPLLDTYTGAAAAYSLRKLRTAYTGDAVEVYNGSSYADIGFNVFGELDTVALASHCGSSDGFVSKWYDQSGNTNTAAQTVTGSMPKIYDGTTGVVTENGKPAVEFDGSDDSINTSTLTALTNPFTASTVATVDASAVNDDQDRVILSSANSAWQATILMQNNYTPDEFQAPAGLLVKTNVAVNNNQNLHTVVFNNSSSEYFLQGQSISTGNFGGRTLAGYSLGANAGTGNFFKGTAQEFIIYDSDQDTAGNRAGIETNINTFYNIF
jgi:hypothetical protein